MGERPEFPGSAIPIGMVGMLSLKVSALKRPSWAGLLILTAVTWATLFPRFIPSMCCDRGIFVSVAERLLAGDTLYAQVFDNKEPLFYYLVAVQRLLGPISEPVMELILSGIAAISAFFIASTISDRRTAVIVGFIVTPLILTGRYYWPGYTHLPGAALCLAAYALTVKRKPAWAGAVAGILVFTKLIMVPLALALSISAIAFARSFRDCCTLMATFVLTIALIAGALLFRAELGPFFETVLLNVSYASVSMTQASSVWATALAHLGRIFEFYLVVLFLSAVAGIATALTSKSCADKPVLQHCVAAAIALLVSLGVLAMTGMWKHHNQILYVPAVLVAVCLSTSLAALRKQGALALAVAICGALLLGGATDVRSFTWNLTDVAARIESLNMLSPESQRILRVAQSGAYARLGAADDRGHASGLQEWVLVCPRFHQYRFDSAVVLQDVFACASTAPTLIVAKSLVTRDDWPAWNHFVADVEELLRSTYTCDADARLRICTRRATQ